MSGIDYDSPFGDGRDGLVESAYELLLSKWEAQEIPSSTSFMNEVHSRFRLSAKEARDIVWRMERKYSQDFPEIGYRASCHLASNVQLRRSSKY